MIAVAPIPDAAGAKATTPGTGALLDLNTATVKEPEKLPGVGKVSAGRTAEYCVASGPLISVEKLSKVKGIGKATLEKLRLLVTVK